MRSLWTSARLLLGGHGGGGNEGRKRLGRYSAGWGKSWAVVTGAAGGIGREFANEAARAGLNVLLVDRDRVGVERAAAEIGEESRAKASKETTKPAVETRVVVADLTQSCAGVEAAMKELGDVAVLINNAGLTVDPPGKYHEVAIEQVEKIVMLNVAAVTTLTHIAVQMMIARGGNSGDGQATEEEKKKRSLVLSMGSFAARVPMPMLQVYSASKRYVEHLSASLAAEYEGKIDFVCGAPWWVATAMTRIRRANWRAISPAHFVRGLLANVGCGSLIVPVNPYPLHAFCDVVVEAAPAFVVNRAIMSFMRRVRASFFRRQQREQQQREGSSATTTTTTTESKKDH